MNKLASPLIFLAFLEFLAFFLPKEIEGIPCFFQRFLLLSQGFQGSLGDKQFLAFLVVFLAVFQKSKERKIRVLKELGTTGGFAGGMLRTQCGALCSVPTPFVLSLDGRNRAIEIENR